MNALGKHLLCELLDCQASLDNIEFIRETLEGSAHHAEATIVESVFHRFNPKGISGVVVISESHIAIHSWPEYRYAAVDVFTCGDAVDPRKVLNYIKKAFLAKATHINEIERGNLIKGQMGLSS